MPRKLALLFGFVGMLAFVGVDAYATVKCKTRSRCRSWSKQYIAKAKTRCRGQGRTCRERHASCGTAVANCSWRSCSSGGASAYAQNNGGSCILNGSRSGRGRYGELEADPDQGVAKSSGNHQMASHVSFQEGRSATLVIDHMVMDSTVDDSFSRLDVVAFVESREGLANDDDDFPPDRIVWKGSIHLQNGVVSLQGFDDDQIRDYVGAKDVTAVQLGGLAQTIPFDGTAEEWDRFAVEISADGGESENAVAAPTSPDLFYPK
ncbi:MAG: hypothetical protein AAGD06_06485 [Acidobacteriota bacterium]